MTKKQIKKLIKEGKRGNASLIAMALQHRWGIVPKYWKPYREG